MHKTVEESGEDPDSAGQRVASQVAPMDSKHDASAACSTITLNFDHHTIRWVTLWPSAAWMLMGQTVVVKTH